MKFGLRERQPDFDAPQDHMDKINGRFTGQAYIMEKINQLLQHALLAFTLTIVSFSSLYAAEYATQHAIEPMSLTALSEDDFLTDIPVVLTATRLAQPITEAPAAITIIDREMIRASGVREIAHLFRMVPGFIVSHDSGHSPIVTYHGLTGEYVARLQVLVDGRSVYSPVFGGVDWANLPLAMDDIERIEIIRGPNAVSFGSNSFLSVINIITQHASETTGSFVRGTRGSNGAKDAYARYGNSTGNFDYRITVGINNDEGFEARADDRSLKTARFRADYQLNAANSLMFQTGVTRGIREIDSDVLQATTNRQANINFEQIQWQRQINNNDALSLQFFHTVEDNNEIFDVTLTEFDGDPLAFPLRVIANNSTRSERFDVELQHTKQLQENMRFVWGLGLRQDSATGPHHFGTDPATGYTGNKKYFYNQMFRAFSNIEWRIKNNITLNLGTMWERSDLADVEFSPRVSLNYSITPEQSIRLSASRATRTPSLNEAYSNYSIPIREAASGSVLFVTTLSKGNINTKPEEVISYEAAYHANLIRKKLSFDLKLFHEELRDLITPDENSVNNPADPLLGEYVVYDNATDAHINGVEANLEFFPLQNTRVILSRSYTDIKSKNPNISSTKLAESAPKHITSLLAINRFPGGETASVLYYRVSDSNGLGSGKSLEGYGHVNIRLGFPFKWTGMRGEIALVVQNATGSYVDWRRDNIAETQQYITVSAQWD